MAPRQKRKREYGGGDGDGDGDDDDTSCGLRQILPVANLPSDFDGEPMDGMQYLFTVRRDARKLPDIKYVANPYARIPPQPAQSTAQAFTESVRQVEAPPPLPSEEWLSKFERGFRNFRGNINQPVVQRQLAGPSKRMIPDKKNRDAWWAFLEGAPESVWNPPRSAKHGKEHAGQWRGATQQPPCATPAEPRELSPTLLFQLDHRFSLHLVMYFTHWFNLYLESVDGNTDDNNSATAYAPTDVHMRWVFALLTRIDLFCSSDEMSCLRSLARVCLALISVVRRGKLGSRPLSAHHERADKSTETDASTTEANVTPPTLEGEGDSRNLSECSMWVVFCAVTRIWGQRDLWNDAEESLRQSSL
ncbi:hypothetical protein BJV78DRAFT_1279781 [Lactifluus subvellereus]|nr:hypothetical protein BJV78DRAFT_1279781 [Lactifluus subvellereus]